MDKTLAVLAFIIIAAIAVGKPPAAKRPQSLPAVKQAPCVGQQVKEFASQHNINPKLVASIIQVESSWKHDAKGKAGELGLMQLMPATAKAFGVSDRLDPKENVLGGIRYLAYCKQKTGKAYIRCYNAGEKGINNPKAYAYEQKVLTALKKTKA